MREAEREAEEACEQEEYLGSVRELVDCFREQCNTYRRNTIILAVSALSFL